MISTHSLNQEMCSSTYYEPITALDAEDILETLIKQHTLRSLHSLTVPEYTVTASHQSKPD